MTAKTRRPEQQILDFLRTGHTDPLPQGWPGENWLVQAQNAERAFREALIELVDKRSAGYSAPSIPALDLRRLVRGKVEPMVQGLFPATEADLVVKMLEESVVIVSSQNIHELIKTRRATTGWTITNLYLDSIGAEPLDDTAPLGFNEDGVSYISSQYFDDEDWYSDYIVHEAAHTFHHCHRVKLGLPETRTRRHLLNIQFNQRETLAERIPSEFSPGCGKVDPEISRTTSRGSQCTQWLEEDFAGLCSSKGCN